MVTNYGEVSGGGGGSYNTSTEWEVGGQVKLKLKPLLCTNTSELGPRENSVRKRTRSAGELGP